MKDKLLIVYIPILLCLLIMLVGYTFLNWLLCLELDLITIKKDITNFGIPFILPLALVFFIARPRLKILNLNRKDGDSWNMAYYTTIWLGLAVPTVIAQDYIYTETGALTEINIITEIHDQPATQYYKIKEYVVDKAHASSHVNFSVSGRNNESLYMQILFTAPIIVNEDDYNDWKDLFRRECDAWLGVKYNKKISNNLNIEKKEQEFEAFKEKSFIDFHTKHPLYTYMERITNRDDDKKLYQKAIESNKLYTSGDIILIPKTNVFESRSGSQLVILLLIVVGVMILWFVLIALPSIDSEKLELRKQKKSDPEFLKANKEYLALLIPQKEYFFTPIFMGINVIIYLLMAFTSGSFMTFDSETLIAWGANYTTGIESGEWWRLFICMFVHAGAMHLFMNIVGLWLAGMFLEPVLTGIRFPLLYISTGALSSWASYCWYDNVLSIGASGVVFGLIGCILIFCLMKVYEKGFATFLIINILIILGINLVVGLVSSGVDNAAHLGGLISGVVLGFLLTFTLDKNTHQEY